MTHTFSFELKPGLEEDQVWSDNVLPLLVDLPANVVDIWQFCVTEMVNNVIDHSDGCRLSVKVARKHQTVEVAVLDDGVGIFRKIQEALNLADERQAILELSKGKLTTDPERHSGQGIFFTSRVLEEFVILSGGAFFFHRADRGHDLITESAAPETGTMIGMRLNNDTDRTLKDVFDQYSSGENYDFSKTVLPLRLAKFAEHELLISRSQAKRVVSRIELFKTVVFDFSDIETIGQGFADEIFRVWAKNHLDVDCVVIAANAAVRQMIALISPAPNVRY